MEPESYYEEVKIYELLRAQMQMQTQQDDIQRQIDRTNLICEILNLANRNNLPAEYFGQNLVKFFIEKVDRDILQNICLVSSEDWLSDSKDALNRVKSLFRFVSNLAFCNKSMLNSVNAFWVFIMTSQKTKLNKLCYTKTAYTSPINSKLKRFADSKQNLNRVNPNEIIKFFENPLFTMSNSNPFGIINPTQNILFENALFLYAATHGYIDWIKAAITNPNIKPVCKFHSFFLAICEQQIPIVEFFMITEDPTAHDFFLLKAAMMYSSPTIIKLILSDSSYDDFRASLDMFKLYSLTNIINEIYANQDTVDSLNNIYELLRFSSIDWEFTSMTDEKNPLGKIFLNAVKLGHTPLVELFIAAYHKINSDTVKKNILFNGLESAIFNAQSNILDLLYPLKAKYTAEELIEYIILAFENNANGKADEINKVKIVTKLFLENSNWEFMPNREENKLLDVMCTHKVTTQLLISNSAMIDFSVNDYYILKTSLENCYVDIVENLLKSDNPQINYFFNTHNMFMPILIKNCPPNSVCVSYLIETIRLLLNDARQSVCYENNNAFKYVCKYYCIDDYIQIPKLFIYSKKIFLGMFFKELISTVDLTRSTNLMKLILEDKSVNEQNYLPMIFDTIVINEKKISEILQKGKITEKIVTNGHLEILKWAREKNINSTYDARMGWCKPDYDDDNRYIITNPQQAPVKWGERYITYKNSYNGPFEWHTETDICEYKRKKSKSKKQPTYFFCKHNAPLTECKTCTSTEKLSKQDNNQYKWNNIAEKNLTIMKNIYYSK